MLIKQKATPALPQYLREEQSPVVFPAAILTQDIRLFIHHPLLIIHGSLLLITQHCVQLSQHLDVKEEKNVRLISTLYIFSSLS